MFNKGFGGRQYLICSLGTGRCKNNRGGIKSLGARISNAGKKEGVFGQNNEKRHNMNTLSGRPQDLDTTWESIFKKLRKDFKQKKDKIQAFLERLIQQLCAGLFGGGGLESEDERGKSGVVGMLRKNSEEGADV